MRTRRDPQPRQHTPAQRPPRRQRTLCLLPITLQAIPVILRAGVRLRGPEDEARAALNEAVSLYDGLQAQWDIRRAEARLRSCGIGRGVRGRPGPRMVSGREALTLTEVKIAALVAGGDSTSDIARGMFLSRRTVQTYISRILTKLGATSQVEIVGEAVRQGISPERDGRPVHRRESVVI